ncbi:EscU/YscU/HrcU family type III secretion system export apparatus switch protein [Xanthomonas cucurbitae]|uniref:EscU/YscU/HrcU family type III secretion system export apparatus switch protein n=1 Tax=Xanthomonas cucurbitae TaxID=56453 RepID=A0ABY7YD51_9XANT|nr:EscU/YscU/HrcU family type III secretion system export apparatus switch protein [Xanthomonas cucurbitae]WDM67817.1 EscU/YscU/HrcU family type III secretion system export apparatus switch protein [Xanthomonas cucurbitae]WDM71691.1 EscU/YscU/HrcU family type III secretion system export apparatus switch protein [Xanthomonas cucurbitae]
MADADQDKTEQPTQSRLEEARRKGEVAKSPDLTAVLMLAVFVVTTMVTGRDIAVALSSATRSTVQLAGVQPRIGGDLVVWLIATYSGVVQAMMPLILALMVVAVVANLGQTGPIFSTHALTPSFQRMHPMNAVKRLFSMRGLWELGKLVLKLALLGLIAYLAVGHAAGFVGRIALLQPALLVEQLRAGFWTTSVYVLMALLVVALSDLVFMRKDHGKKMRMSRREVRDDAKRRDGDPEVKSKQRRQIRELLKTVRALPRVGDADVIVTNPTHYAVAVQYRPQTMRAPIVLCKGRGLLAARVRSAAQRASIPVVRMPSLARALYRQCPIDAVVPEELFGALAPVYRKLYIDRRVKAAA